MHSQSIAILIGTKGLGQWRFQSVFIFDRLEAYRTCAAPVSCQFSPAFVGMGVLVGFM